MKSNPQNPAIIAAEKAQEKLADCLIAGRSFRLEAGAGAGKTYSLVAALKRIIAERGAELIRNGQRVACITFTEVGRNEIAQEIEDHPAILVETIHAFSWGFLGQFQKSLRKLVEAMEERHEKIDLGGGLGSKPVEYSHGFFGVHPSRITLAHDDIPLFMGRLLAERKFQQLLMQQFPFIFIDEYQDTDRGFMEAVTEHFLKTGRGPLIGLFGDHWQTIYRSEYELANYPIELVGKGSNFRSVPAIVNVLNNLRPDLPQEVSAPGAVGEARFFHANAYEVERTNESHSKGDVPPEMARSIREKLMQQLQHEGWELTKTKVLILTHNVLASEQGYPRIAEIFRGRTELFAKKEDPTIKFLLDTVEPMCAAYAASQFGELFRIFGEGLTIRRHEDKRIWRRNMDELLRLRTSASVGDVLDLLKHSKRPPLSERVAEREKELVALSGEAIPEEATGLYRHNLLRGVSYGEILELRKFVEGHTPFATQHSVKGAEFENVLVVLGGGWNHYNWPQLLELIETKALTSKNTKGYYRARNLFYVAISRPKTRLAVLATQTLPSAALAAVNRLFGPENVKELSPH